MSITRYFFSFSFILFRVFLYSFSPFWSLVISGFLVYFSFPFAVTLSLLFLFRLPCVLFTFVFEFTFFS